MNWIILWWTVVATVSAMAACGIAALTIRISRSPSGLYERNRQKALRGECLTEAEVDDVLARH